MHMTTTMWTPDSARHPPPNPTAPPTVSQVSITTTPCSPPKMLGRPDVHGTSRRPVSSLRRFAASPKIIGRWQRYRLARR